MSADAGAAQRAFVEERARLKRIFGAVDGVEVAGEQELPWCLWADAHAQRLSGCAVERHVFKGGVAQRGKLGRQCVPHAVEAGEVFRAGIDAGPGGEQIVECGGVHAVSGLLQYCSFSVLGREYDSFVVWWCKRSGGVMGKKTFFAGPRGERCGRGWSRRVLGGFRR